MTWWFHPHNDLRGWVGGKYHVWIISPRYLWWDWRPCPPPRPGSCPVLCTTCRTSGTAAPVPCKNHKHHSTQAVSRTTCRTCGTAAPVPCKNHKHQSMQAVSRINALPTILDPTAVAGSCCCDTVTLGPVSRFGLMVKALGWWAEGLRLEYISVRLSLRKGCGLWTLSCDFVPHN